MTARWLAVALAAAAFVATPIAVAARPVADSSVSAADLAALILRSAPVGWSGQVTSSGTLQVPQTDSFANLALLLGQRNELRVWWRGPEQWRVDRMRSTGETDLFRDGGLQVRWVFEQQRAVTSPVSRIRLPDAPDVVPAVLARSMLQGVRAAEISRLPSRRVAGVAAAGLRLVPDDAAASVGRVDIWADPVSGVALRVEISGRGDPQPVLSTTVTEIDLHSPADTTTTFVPGPQVQQGFEQSVDVAAEANALQPYDLPATLAGLPSRDGSDPGAVGIYGRGPTTMFVLPLRGNVAGPLRRRLRQSAAVVESAAGTRLTAGPVTLLLTPRRAGPPQQSTSFLLTGTVQPEVLERAAAQLGPLQ